MCICDKCPLCQKTLIEVYARSYEVSCGWHSLDQIDTYQICDCGVILDMGNFRWSFRNQTKDYYWAINLLTALKQLKLLTN